MADEGPWRPTGGLAPLAGVGCILPRAARSAPTLRERFPSIVVDDEGNLKQSGFVFSAKSKSKLKGVNPHLVEVTKLALQLSNVDFAVHEGLRTKDRQALLVKQGKSRTFASRHLTGDAVDLVPYVDGKLTWAWQECYQIAAAMALAEIVIGARSGKDLRLIEWGGVWDSRLADMLDDYSHAESTPEQRLKYHVETYKARFKRMYNRQPFADGVHFQIAR